MNEIVSCRHLHQNFSDHCVLRDFNLTVNRGEFLTLLGPSGCGKTTLLRLIAGFEIPSQGQIILNGQDVSKMPPHKRHVNTVFQSYALFPHMSVFENVAFGLRLRKQAKAEIEAQVQDALRTVKLEAFAARMPHQLSGGQQQRVAMARAIINKPLVLLLDEPFSSLDYHLRKEMQMELKQIQQQSGITFIFVTHDQEEALAMSDRIAVMLGGKIVQMGTPREIYEEPESLAVAQFIGEVNIFETEIKRVTNATLTVCIENKEIELKNRKKFRQDDEIYTLLRPEDIRVWDESEVKDKNTQNMLPGIIDQVIYKGSIVNLKVRLPSGKIISATEFFDEDDADLLFERGENVWVEWFPGWEVLLPHLSEP